MILKESKYYNEKLLGKNLYDLISNNDKILTAQKFFNINKTQREYHIKDEYKDYNLKIYEDYYELNCEGNDDYLFLVFDKPVHITGKHCVKIVAPKIVVKCNHNGLIYKCVSNKVIIDNEYKDFYEISFSKFNNIYFYNSKVYFFDPEINNLFIFDKKIKFHELSELLDYHKIKVFGSFDARKNKILKSEYFRKRIIHIE